MMPTALSLFAGGGGLDLGASMAGFDVVASIERDSHACATLRANFGHEVVQADATLVDYSRWAGVDLIMGGPPCQGHSAANPRNIGAERNDLVWEMVRATEQARPRAVLIENVPAFDQDLLGRVLARLTSLGYWTACRVLDAADYGVPQNRRRLFMIASRDMLAWPQPTHARRWNSIDRALADLWPDLERRPTPAFLAQRLAIAARDDHRLIDPRNSNKRGPSGRAGSRPAFTMTTRPHEVRWFRDGETGVIGNRAAARLQGFPDGYAFAGSRTAVGVQIGNAVPPPLAAAIAGVLA